MHARLRGTALNHSFLAHIDALKLRILASDEAV